jgi:type-F conjugative transfer system pilin assembly protein TrbC
MRLLIALTVLTFASLNGDDWLDQVQNRVDVDAIEWAKQLSSTEGRTPPKGCKGCLTVPSDTDTSIRVLMSFSMSDQAWLSLSKEMESFGGVFVLRGIPGDSFGDFQKRMVLLKKRGMTATVQIDPAFFRQVQPSAVPVFVIQRDDELDTLNGNVSLEFALNQMRVS